MQCVCPKLANFKSGTRRFFQNPLTCEFSNGSCNYLVTSTLQVAVAYAALAALLDAAPDWIQADGSGTGSSNLHGKQSRELSAIESNTMTALVNNALGVSAKMLLDWGDHQVGFRPG